ETTSQVATLAPRDALRKPGSAGRPIYPNEIRIDSASGSPAESLAAEPGAGEILVRGPVVMQGYLGLPAESASALQSGWLHTGDIGKLDSDGYLYVLDRRSDLIITGGENVYPAEVEAALLSHPAVEEAGVVGLPDDHWGQRVVAVVRLLPLDPSPHVDELRAHCSQLLAGYKVPAQIIVVSAPLPRTASGKLKRDELRQRLAEGEREGLS
ncbi:MAG TPA: p-hydroxycinnamoyl-CoA synthetase, partial [Gemmatimonadales bacterium]|nr:p-hydroxycinnamoyl-CoA synthetase [Gemmatimonadales bacterium]